MDPTAGLKGSLETAIFLARRILRHWRYLLIGQLLALAGASTWAFTQPDRYRSETLIQVSPALLSDLVPGAEPVLEDVKQLVQQLTLSRTRLEQVLTEVNPYPGQPHGDALLDHFRAQIAIEMHGEDTFLLSYEHGDPLVAQAVTRRMAELFIEGRFHSRTERAQATARVTAGQVATLLEDLGRREDALTTFQIEHAAAIAAIEFERNGGAPARAATTSTVRHPQIVVVGEAARELQQLRAERAAAASDLRTLQQAARNTPEIEAVRAEIATAQRERTALLARYRPGYPSVDENERRIAALQRQLSALLAAAAPGAPQGRALELSQRIADLDAEIARVQRGATHVVRPPAADPRAQPARALTLPEVAAQLAHLQGEVATTREQHRQAVGRNFEAESALSIETQRAAESVTVIDPARVPSRPFAPNRSKLVGLGALAGLLLGLLLAFARSVLDTRIFEEGDLARAVDVPVLVTIPAYREG